MTAICDRDDLDDIFGVSNVDKIADADGDEDATKIASRVTWACNRATTKMWNRLRGGPYAVPITSPDDELVEMTARWAGVLLYNGPGMKDDASEEGDAKTMSGHMRLIEEFVRGVHAGTIRFDAEMATRNYPTALHNHD